MPPCLHARLPARRPPACPPAACLAASSPPCLHGLSVAEWLARLRGVSAVGEVSGRAAAAAFGVVDKGEEGASRCCLAFQSAQPVSHKASPPPLPPPTPTSAFASPPSCFCSALFIPFLPSPLHRMLRLPLQPQRHRARRGSARRRPPPRPGRRGRSGRPGGGPAGPERRGPLPPRGKRGAAREQDRVHKQAGAA